MICNFRFETGYDDNLHKYAVVLGSRTLTETDNAALAPNCTDGNTHVCQYKGALKRPIANSEVKYLYDGEFSV